MDPSRHVQHHEPHPGPHPNAQSAAQSVVQSVPQSLSTSIPHTLPNAYHYHPYPQQQPHPLGAVLVHPNAHQSHLGHGMPVQLQPGAVHLGGVGVGQPGAVAFGAQLPILGHPTAGNAPGGLFDPNDPALAFIDPRLAGASPGSQYSNAAGALSVLTSAAPLPGQVQSSTEALAHISPESDIFQPAGNVTGDVTGDVADDVTDDVPGDTVRDVSGPGNPWPTNLIFVPNPPDLELWRQRLFNVNQPIIMTDEEFRTYWAHIDNVWSRRSVQRYKRKPMIAHYCDCRFKGRQPGTRRNVDPNKKKRQRTPRPLNLCESKIKIVQHFATRGVSQHPVDPTAPAGTFVPGHATAELFGMLTPSGTLPPDHPALNGGMYYTIERVHSNGCDGVGNCMSCSHKHELEASDQTKGNFVARTQLKAEKERKQLEKTYNQRATGPAHLTVKRHAKDHELKLYGNCLCPFTQRVWMALELKRTQYQYIEIDPFEKPGWFLAMHPRGVVPLLSHGDWVCYESSVILEYIEELNMAPALLPMDRPQQRADCRMWVDAINRNIVPAYFRVLMAQNVAEQLEHLAYMNKEVAALVQAADPRGPFFLGPEMSLVDVHIGPFFLRLTRIFKQYRGWEEPLRGSRLWFWMQAIERHEVTVSTTSNDGLSMDAFERYDKSQLGDVIVNPRELA